MHNFAPNLSAMGVSKNQVFISFRGEDVRTKLLSFLIDELKRGCVEYCLDNEEMKGQVLDILLQRIQESWLVLMIFSQNYMDSIWCIKELLATTKDMIEQRQKVIPIFYNVSVHDVKENWKVGEHAKGEGGEDIEIKVKEALRTVTRYMGLRSAEYRDECTFVKDIVKKVQRVLTSIEQEEKEKTCITNQERSEGDTSLTTKMCVTGEGEKCETTPKVNFFGITRRQQKLQEMLKLEIDNKETRVVGVVGMAGIGKTTLAKKLFVEWKKRFQRKMFFEDMHKTSEANGTTCLRIRLLQKLLKKKTITEETTHESMEEYLLESKVFLFLDDLRDKKQLESLLGNRKWIKPGSKIVIVTSDKSLVEGLVDDIFVVPGLNEREGLECFCYHAFGENRGKSVHQGNFMKLSREFVDYARGNPLALKVLGVELHGRDEAHWESKLRTLTQSPSKTIQDVLNVSYEGLSQRQKDAFLDVSCFFRSENHNLVTSLVGGSEIKDLADKFLIDITGGRVEMHGLLYTLGKKLASQKHQRLWNHQDIIRVLKKKPGKINIDGIRGMFLDMSEVENYTPLSKEAFYGMDNLQYLKFYNSCFPQDYEDDCKVNFPDELQLPLKEIRYLHWLKFPKEEVQKFNPKNLIDLKLPNSKIKRLWDGDKDTSSLKWVDLSHSVDLCDLSGLSGARNLEKLNLEGCTGLKKIHEEMQNLTSLIVLNLRGCTTLKSLAKMNMKSLKTLILSDCSNLEDFQVISEHLEALYLDGTNLKGLPPSTAKLQKLVLLNLKDCKSLETVPDCLGNMKALQDVILSGCSRLESLPDLQENMRRLRIFLLDGTSIKEVPRLSQNTGILEWPHRGVQGLPLLRHLCLRGNNKIQSLQPHIGQLYHLKCIDLKDCKNLAYIPTLPPNLERLNAHGCESLETLGNPLAFLVLADQIHATFIFSNCHKLEEVAKTCIISYIQKKSQLMSNAIDRYNLGSVVESFVGACFPGCEVPAWISHQAYGSVIALPKFSRHLSNNNWSTGAALSAIVSFTDYQDQNNHFLVKCTYEFKNADGSLRGFSSTVGGIEQQNIGSDHVFIGYTSWLHIKKEEEEEVSLRFEVVDATGAVVKKCQVLKCGFSLVYKSDETESVSWEVNSVPPMRSPADSELIVSDESGKMEEIIQQRETDSEGVSMSPADSNKEEINETSIGDKSIFSGISMLRANSEESELTVNTESGRMEEIIQQRETSSMGDDRIRDVSMSAVDSNMEEINQQDETSSCVSPEDTDYGYGGLLSFCWGCFYAGK